jgi:diacylglycerol kinase family enzyme
VSKKENNEKKMMIIAAFTQAAYAFAQIELRSEYLPQQKYINNNGDKTEEKALHSPPHSQQQFR